MSGRITEDIVNEFRRIYVKDSGLGIENDETLKGILEASYSYIEQQTDTFDITKNNVGKSLVFDRARYIRANASELFYSNYLPDLNALGLQLAMEREKNDS